MSPPPLRTKNWTLKIGVSASSPPFHCTETIFPSFLHKKEGDRSRPLVSVFFSFKWLGEPEGDQTDLSFSYSTFDFFFFSSHAVVSVPTLVDDNPEESWFSLLKKIGEGGGVSRRRSSY